MHCTRLLTIPTSFLEIPMSFKQPIRLHLISTCLHRRSILMTQLALFTRRLLEMLSRCSGTKFERAEHVLSRLSAYILRTRSPPAILHIRIFPRDIESILA
jgi:hypothetical protein